MPDKVGSIQNPMPEGPRVSFNVWAIVIVLGLFFAMVVLVYSFAPPQ